MTRWGMVIDLARCIGCYNCVLACKTEHFLPAGISWSRVLVDEIGKYPTVWKETLPVLCNNCKDPICEKVCPTGATARREDGIVTIDYDKCIGCRYCLVACPYQSRVYMDKIEMLFVGQSWTPFEEISRGMYQTGVVAKCDFCRERIDTGIKEGLKPGIDRDATPACVNACPAEARYFGDLNDPNSNVSRLIRERRGTQNHPEFGTDPSVFYLR